MTLETENVLDRRRLRRRLSIWRGLAVVCAVAALGLVMTSSEQLAALTGKKHIARVAIEGTITEDRSQLELLKKIADADGVAALLLFINSPGGTTTGGEALFEALRHVAEKKPVVAQFGTVAASAGYIAGLGADYIVTRGNTITGSIGVLMQWPEVTQLMEKVGVKMHEVKSGHLKASPSPFAPVDDASRQVVQDMISEGFQWFIGLVERRRGLTRTQVPGLDTGRVYSGREAVELKLADQIGGEAAAVRWLEEERRIEKDLNVVDWKPTTATGWGLTSLIYGLADRVLPFSLSALAARDKALSTLGLDGLVSVWHPSEN